MSVDQAIESTLKYGMALMIIMLLIIALFCFVMAIKSMFV